MIDQDNSHTLPVGDKSVSRERLDRLEIYASLVGQWTARINLIARSTTGDIWSRHIRDSAQIASLLPAQATALTDLGSGGGFPGLVLAIVRPELHVTLIESDARKAAFLRTAVRETGARATVIAKRIEDAPPQNADVVTARALTSLERLLGLVTRHLSPAGTAILPKGRKYQEELDVALATWRFHCETYPSRTESGAAVLKLTEISRV